MLRLIFVLALTVFGCGTGSLPPAPETMPPLVLANLGDAGIKDLRHLYRATNSERVLTARRYR